MQATMMRSAIGTRQSTAPAPLARCTTRPAPRRAGLTVRNALIGDVNDPEKSRENMKKKEEDSDWAAPKNKNPLEGKQIAHEGEPAVEEVGQAAEKVKKSVADTAKQAREAVERLNKNADN